MVVIFIRHFIPKHFSVGSLYTEGDIYGIE